LSLPVNEVKMGQPCDLLAFRAFFGDKRNSFMSGDLLQVLLLQKYRSKDNTAMYFKDKLAELCIVVDSAKVIDSTLFDCVAPNKTSPNETEQGVCTCGQLLNLIDPHMQQPPLVPG
jgi:hypothetical protein